MRNFIKLSVEPVMLFRWNEFLACARHNTMVKTINDTMKALVILIVNVIVAFAVFDIVNQIIHMFTILWTRFGFEQQVTQSLRKLDRISSRIYLIRKTLFLCIYRVCSNTMTFSLSQWQSLKGFIFFKLLFLFSKCFKNYEKNYPMLPKRKSWFLSWFIGNFSQLNLYFVILFELFRKNAMKIHFYLCTMSTASTIKWYVSQIWKSFRKQKNQMKPKSN